ncbi:MAG: alpha/beta hydrolase [Lachnospiraceae bacterium]|nr:alpha/beta hydrolase [Lachnospiraceae bacterium]
MNNREYYIDKDGFKLHAKLDFPTDAESKLPILILIHGLTGQMDEAQLYGVRDAALDAGCACLRVDMYGHGKSDGDFSNHNVMEWLCEILYIIDHARNQEFVTDIYLAGHSQGGLAVILAAGMKSDQIKALIPISPAINIVSDSKKGEFFGTQFDKDNLPETVHFWDEFDIKANYFRVAKTLNVDEAISAYDGPVLIVHGTNDESVPVSYGIEVADKYQNATLKLIEGDSHCFDYHLDELILAVKTFLLEHR